MAIMISQSTRYSGLAPDSVGQRFGETDTAIFQLLSSFVEIAVGVGVSAFTANPILGAQISAAVGLTFATARLGENLSSGRDFSLFATILDFAIPAGSYGAIRYADYARIANNKKTVLGAATAATVAGSEAIEAVEGTVRTFARNTGIPEEFVDLVQSGAATEDVLNTLGITPSQALEYQRGYDDIQQLLRSGEQTRAYAATTKHMIENNVKNLDLSKLAEMLEESTSTLQSTFHNIISDNPYALSDWASIARGNAKVTLEQTSKFFSAAGDVGSRAISNEAARRLMYESGASVDDIKLVLILLDAAKDQSEFNTILLGFVRTLDGSQQTNFLNALIENIKFSGATFSTTGDAMVDIANFVDNASAAKVSSRIAALAADTYVAEATKPSILQKLLKVNSVVDDTTGAVTYTKNMTNYQVFKGREFYDKVARRVQWVKTNDAARDATTWVYREIKTSINKSEKLKAIRNWIKKKTARFSTKLSKVKDIREVFAAGGGQAIDSSWIVGYKLVNEKANKLGKVLIMIYFDPAITNNKDPVFVFASTKELIDFVKAPSPGQFYLDTWAIARNGKKGSNSKLNKALMSAVGSGTALGLLPIQVIRTLTSVVSTLVRTGYNIHEKGWSGWLDDTYGIDFYKSVLTNIGTRGGRILGSTVGRVSGNSIIRRESQRFSNLIIATGTRNITRGEDFFMKDQFTASLRSAGVTSVTTLNRTIAARYGGTGFSSINSGIQRIAVSRYANLAGGLVRSPFQGGSRPAWTTIRF